MFSKTSNRIDPRNPFKMDPDQVDYEMDSEDEIQEMNAENLEDVDDEEEEEEEEDEDDQFIVPDGYLSQGECSNKDLISFQPQL